MRGLGYDRFGARGGDLGGGVTARLGQFHPDAVAGIHVTNVYGEVSDGSATDEERSYLAAVEEWERTEGAYGAIQGTRPQTLAAGLADSPAGLSSWIVRRDTGRGPTAEATSRACSAKTTYDQHHDLLGDRHDRLLLPPILGQPKQREATAVGPDRGSMRSSRSSRATFTGPHGPSPSAPTTSPAGPRCLEVDISPRWSSPRLSPPRSSVLPLAPLTRTPAERRRPAVRGGALRGTFPRTGASKWNLPSALRGAPLGVTTRRLSRADPGPRSTGADS